MLYQLIRPLLFTLDAEKAHDLSFALLRGVSRSPFAGLTRYPQVDDPVEIMGIRFPNRVGLAAGLDKNGRYIDALAGFGFGFVEVGTITPVAQPGNPKPRLFRLPQVDAIINRMGFNNLGVEYLIEQVKERSSRIPLGINIGKNKVTPNDDAVNDYLICLRAAYRHADYITINISSPNTPGLRELQFGENLKKLLSELKTEQGKLHGQYARYVPLAVKVAPDLTDEEIHELAETFKTCQMDALIATNTTNSRDEVRGLSHAEETGGLSGAPIIDKSNHVLSVFKQALGDEIPIIGVGGINSAKDAVSKIEAGADLVQIYSGLIYQGPDLVSASAEAIKQFCRNHQPPANGA